MIAMPRAMATDQRYYGVLAATVQENANDPENLARVRVTYQWFDNTTKSEWARVCQVYAGKNYGVVFVPEIGDEVLIALYQGDMRFPYVLGGVHNREDPPPTARDNGPDQKLIRTKAGHEILFDDKSKDIRITTAQGGTVTVNADGSITLKAPKVTVDADAIELGAGAAHQAVLGDLLQTAFNTHTHTAPNGPTSPPVAPLSPTTLSSKVKLQ